MTGISWPGADSLARTTLTWPGESLRGVAQAWPAGLKRPAARPGLMAWTWTHSSVPSGWPVRVTVVVVAADAAAGAARRGGHLVAQHRAAPVRRRAETS